MIASEPIDAILILGGGVLVLAVIAGYARLPWRSLEGLLVAVSVAAGLWWGAYLVTRTGGFSLVHLLLLLLPLALAFGAGRLILGPPERVTSAAFRPTEEVRRSRIQDRLVSLLLLDTILAGLSGYVVGTGHWNDVTLVAVGAVNILLLVVYAAMEWRGRRMPRRSELGIWGLLAVMSCLTLLGGLLRLLSA